MLPPTAGKVTIKGECVNCNGPSTTTHKPSTPARGHGGKTTAKPRKATPARGGSDSDSDEDDDSGWSLHQSADGGQHINRRHKRQWGGTQVINLGEGGGGGGGWSGGRVTTIDSRGYPGTVVRNADCVSCNIRG